MVELEAHRWTRIVSRAGILENGNMASGDLYKKEGL
jgi:hypothetical protein